MAKHLRILVDSIVAIDMIIPQQTKYAEGVYSFRRFRLSIPPSAPMGETING